MIRLNMASSGSFRSTTLRLPSVNSAGSAQVTEFRRVKAINLKYNNKGRRVIRLSYHRAVCRLQNMTMILALERTANTFIFLFFGFETRKCCNDRPGRPGCPFLHDLLLKFGSVRAVNYLRSGNSIVARLPKACFL